MRPKDGIGNEDDPSAPSADRVVIFTVIGVYAFEVGGVNFCN